jgi:MerR family transcriptional regulator, light-induced transcriptional regulator
MNVGLSIKDLENLSGIKAHTIRVWEKRYNIFEPQRTETNIRLYSNDDLKKLLNITSILDSGIRISKASRLSTEQINDLILDIQNQSLEAERSININNLIVATLQCDVLSFDKEFNTYAEQHGIENTIENILYPMLVRIGLMWTASKLNPAQEHFASQLIRQKLFTAIDYLPITQSAQKYLLYLPAKEDHEISLLYAYYLIKKAGLQALYLGPNVPLDDVVACAHLADVTHILFTITIPRSESQMQGYLSQISEKLATKYNVAAHLASTLSIDTHIFDKKINFLTNIEQFKNLL